MDLTVNDEEVFLMTLDDIIRLQEVKKNRVDQNGAILTNGNHGSNEVVNEPSTSLDAIVDARMNKNLSGFMDSGRKRDHEMDHAPFDNGNTGANVGNSECDGNIVGDSNPSSVFDEYASVPYDYPLSRGVSIVERQHGLTQNHHMQRNHHRFRKNNFKPYQNSRYCTRRDCCSNRCRAQVRLYNLEAKLRAKRGRSMTNGYQARRHSGPPMKALSRSTSMASLQSYNSNHSCCSCDSHVGPFQHRSRSRSRGPPNTNRYRSQSRNQSQPRNRSQSRNRSRSRSRARSQSRNRFSEEPVIFVRKQQIFDPLLQDQLKMIEQQMAKRTPMASPAPHCAEQCKPVVHHTFMSLTTRFNGYYV